MELRWQASLSASSLHTALCCVEGLPVANAQLAEPLLESINQLVATVEAAALQPVPALQTLVELSSQYENNRQLAELVLVRLRGLEGTSEAEVSRLAAAVGGLKTRLLAVRPELVDELAVRGAPLQQQWAARGSGLLRQLGRLTDESFLAASAEVVLVAPCVGGHGWAHLRTNRVSFEAVLANPHDELPEPLRLAWLLAQLNVDVPRYAEAVARKQLALIAQLATLPAVLSAGEYVEWSSCTPESIQQALTCWHVRMPPSQNLVEQLFTWWTTYNQGTTAWDVAWRALGTLLAE